MEGEWCVKVQTNINAAVILNTRGLGDSTLARRYLASDVARLCDPYVPMQQGTLKNFRQVDRDGRYILYNQPYAHYQYYGEVMAGRAPKHYTGEAIDYHGGPMRGSPWDARMMADHKDEIVDDLAKFVGGKRK